MPACRIPWSSLGLPSSLSISAERHCHWRISEVGGLGTVQGQHPGRSAPLELHAGHERTLKASVHSAKGVTRCANVGLAWEEWQSGYG
jgi:hypothetical protein